MKATTTKTLVKIALAALSAGFFLRLVTSDDDESRITKTVVTTTVTFALGAVGGLALLAGPIGALMLAGAAAFAILALAVGKGAFDEPAKVGYESTRSGASAAVQRAEELREQAEAAAASAEVDVDSDGDEVIVTGSVPTEEQGPGVTEPVGDADAA